MKAHATALVGVQRWSLDRHVDARGDLHELQRDSWPGAPRVARWDLVRSRANVLRGMRVHADATSYHVLVQGRAWLGLADARPHSPTWRATDLLLLEGDAVAGISVPPGVVHGLWHETDGVGLVALDQVDDGSEPLGCRWDDPALGLRWPCASPLLGDGDRDWPAAAAMFARLASRHAVA